MSRKEVTLFLLCSLWMIGCGGKAETREQGRSLPFHHLVDCTYTLTNDFPYIHVHNLTFPFRLETMATLQKNGVAANTWIIHEHLGTHIDAPNHFAAGGLSVDAIKPEDLIVPLSVIDIREKAAQDADTELTVEDIVAFEKIHGQLQPHSCVMLFSGWGNKVHTPDYMGVDSGGVKHFPGFSVAAIKFLVEQRAIAGIGADVISFDPGRDNNYSAHKVLFAYGKWAIENVANVEQLPSTGATLIIGAPKVGGATGGIARIFAVW